MNITKKVLAILLSFTLLFSMMSPFSIVRAENPVDLAKGREKMNFNQGWKFVRGNIQEAIAVDYPIEQLERWENVDLPHSVRYEPYNASGGENYQGAAMYRKHFMLDDSYAGKKMFIEFEGAMGVSDVWVNGQHLQTKIAKKTGNNTQYGGYLPFVLDVTDLVFTDGSRNVITVLTDNSNNPNVPPGKPQEQLDFTYFGGIYRNVWFETMSPVHITNSNFEDIIAGGGVLVDYPSVSESEATVAVKTHIRNESSAIQIIELKTVLLDRDNVEVGSATQTESLNASDDISVNNDLVINNPKLWNLDNPYMHKLVSTLSIDGHVVDMIETDIGIRQITMDPNTGVSINGSHTGFLSGVNRHQEYAYIGYAASSSLQRSDAIKFKEAGFNIVRTAHHPQSVDFLKATDELGILVIESIPGWQHWSGDRVFAERVKEDTRQMIRRDRNHPSILTFEISLNESPGVPAGFTNDVEKIAKEEHPSVKTSAENPHQGAVADILYGTPSEVESWSSSALSLIREYGDHWEEQNGRFVDFARVTRGVGSFYPGGEASMVRQANNRLWNGYSFYGTGSLSLSEGIRNYDESNHRFAAVTMWLGIDHNRGYSSTMSPAGIWDLLRLPKYSYYAFTSQRPVEKDAYLESQGVETGPLLFIASSWGEKAPVLDKHGTVIGTDSSREIYVYSNAKNVRLSVLAEDSSTLWSETRTPITEKTAGKLDHPPFFFDNVPYTKGSTLRAEGLDADEIVIAEQEIQSAGQPTKIRLEVDKSAGDLTADGSDLIMVYAYVLDENGTVNQEASNKLHFSVKGEGSIIADGNKRVGANPVDAEAGVKGVYIKSTHTPGDLEISVSSDGLESATKVITSQKMTEKAVPFEMIDQGIPMEHSSMHLADKQETLPGRNVQAISKNTITKDGQEFVKSIVVNNMNELEYELSGAYKQLSGKLALENAAATPEGAVFKVYLDGVLSFVSVPVTNQVVELNLNISGAQIMTIVAEAQNRANVRMQWLSPYITEGNTAIDNSELRDNLALNKSANASSTDPGTDVSHAIDGDNLSLWRSEDTVTKDSPQTWNLDLGEYYNIRDANLMVEHDYMKNSYTIYTSKDNINWTEQSSSSKTAHGNNQLDKFVASDVRYIKVNFTEVSSTQGEETSGKPKASIKEFSVYRDMGVEDVKDYNLMGFEIAGKAIEFKQHQTNYEFEFKGFETEFLIKAMARNPDSEVKVNGETITNNASIYLFDQNFVKTVLNQDNQIVITVTSPDGLGTKTYTITAKGKNSFAYFNAYDTLVKGSNQDNVWTYGYQDKNAKSFTALPNESGGAISGEYAFGIEDEWLYAGPRFMHPGNQKHAVRTFTAPKDGDAYFVIFAEKFNNQPGDVGIKIMKNKETIWPLDQEQKTLKSGSSISEALSISLETGDVIDVIVDALSGNGGDGTFVSTSVQYTDSLVATTAVIKGETQIFGALDSELKSTYTAEAFTSDGYIIPDAVVNWKLKDAVAGVTLDEDGVLTIAPTTRNKSVTIQAWIDNKLMDEIVVSIKRGTMNYLSDLEWESASSGDGSVNKDKANNGQAITLTDQNNKPVVYEKGLGTHAYSEIVYNITDHDYTSFDALIGVDHSQNPDGFHASVRFKVYFNEDTTPVYESGIMVYDTPFVTLSVPLDETVEKITLVVDGGDQNWSDHANWANAHFKTLQNDDKGPNAQEVADQLVFTIKDDMLEFGNNIDGFDVAITKSSNSEIIGLDGNVTYPSEMTDVNVEVNVTNSITGDSANRVFVISVPAAQKPPVDTSALEEKLASVAALTEADYTVASWSALQTVVDEAETLKANALATQTEVDAMTLKLQSAVEGLKEKPVDPDPDTDLDASLLEFMILEAEEQVEEGALVGVIEAVVERFNKALKEAKDMLAKVNADPTTVTQAEIDLATKNLIDMLHLLDFKGTKGKLQRLVDQCEEYGADKALYSKATYDVFEAALDEAKTVLADETAFQDEIDKAWFDLATGFAGLRKIPNKDALKELINKARSIDSSQYTVASFRVLADATDDANTVYNDINATEKAVVSSEKAVKTALAGLVPLVVTTDGTTTTTKASDSDKAIKVADTTTKAATSVPKTGENSLVILLFTLLSLSCVVTVVIRKKKVK